MTKVVYHIVEHDGGWAYQVNGTYSETFGNRNAAIAAAKNAAGEQRVAGTTGGIVFEDASGQWHEELSDGTNRPETSVDEGR